MVLGGRDDVAGAGVDERADEGARVECAGVPEVGQVFVAGAGAEDVLVALPARAARDADGVAVPLGVLVVRIGVFCRNLRVPWAFPRRARSRGPSARRSRAWRRGTTRAPRSGRPGPLEPKSGPTRVSKFSIESNSPAGQTFPACTRVTSAVRRVTVARRAGVPLRSNGKTPRFQVRVAEAQQVLVDAAGGQAPASSPRPGS